MSKKRDPLQHDDEGYLLNTTEAAITNYPSPIRQDAHKLSDEEKIARIEPKMREILEILGLDLEDESIKRTPYRIAKMYVSEVFSGMDPKNFPKISRWKDDFHHDQNTNIVFMRVGFTSFCEHHLVPMNGEAFVAYKPNGHLIGLSKIPRIVRFFAKRPQLQERLTAQIADALSKVLQTDDVAVSISATHYCVVARGIEDEGSHTITNVLRGQFNSNPHVREEFFDAIQRIPKHRV
jgi:GTP cyclohydrolase I